MKTVVEFDIVVNDRLYISLATESVIEPVLADIRSRDFGGHPCVVKVFKRTVEPYEVRPDNDK